MRSSGWLRALLVLLSLTAGLMPQRLLAQGGTSTASFSGRVADASGGVLPGVAVTLTNEATNQRRTVVTDEQGVYRFAGLTPGKYSIASELEGFAKFVQTEITLQVGSAVDVNITMRLSSLSETLTVTGESPIVERAKTDLSTVISRSCTC